MYIRILGSSAGGGLPQWNCNCRNCSQARTRGAVRTQDSIAVSGDNHNWLLVNASPDIRQQLAAFPSLHPNESVRENKIAAIMLLDSQIDHTAGLLSLREAKVLKIYSTNCVLEDLTTTFPIFPMLESYCTIEHHSIVLNQHDPFKIDGLDNLLFSPLAITSKAPPYSLHRQNGMVGDTIGIGIKDVQTGKKFFYTSCLGEFSDSLMTTLQDMDCILIDGTFWQEDELTLQGISKKFARDMGHLPLSGEAGILKSLSSLNKPRKLIVHVNNTNPILDESSKEHDEMRRMGFELSFDGQEILL